MFILEFTKALGITTPKASPVPTATNEMVTTVHHSSVTVNQSMPVIPSGSSGNSEDRAVPRTSGTMATAKSVVPTSPAKFHASTYVAKYLIT